MSNTDHDAKVQELLKEVLLYKNPEELEEMRKIIKKNVPFSRRGYFMAYLYVREFGANAKSVAKQGSKPAAKPVAKPADSVSFYINVGRASHSNPKELAAFICETAKISSEDILSVAFKQNYSFVYIRKDKADGIIDAVSGQAFKGRKVKMNFSKESGTEQ